jgi:LacI family transcriptional regulator
MPRLANLNTVTVQDLARETGLSPSSVSAVLSGQHVKRRIAAGTVERVLAAARQLRYVPNVTARSLRAKASGTKHVVLSILTAFEAPVFLVTQALRAVEKAVARHGEAAANYTVNIEMFHAGELARLPGLIDGHRCNGAIITNTLDADDRFLSAAHLPFPVVLLGRHITGYHGVSGQLETMGRQAAAVLVGAGRSRLAVLCPAVLGQATRRRLNSFAAAAEELTGAPPAIISCQTLQEKAGYEGMRHYLAQSGGCDGVFAVTDGLAIGAYLAIRRAGKKIPRDIAMVGVGDNSASDFIDPPLTSFEVAEEAQNHAAAEMLLNLVHGLVPESQSVEVPVSLVLRESTGHPPLNR